MEEDPLWYKDAIIYELHVKSFCDANGDGIGDFQGLTQKLDYLQELGVTAIWLLPFYPSPLRDDGYDIADYTSVNPQYGTLGDFKKFLREAHARGLRVITELVLNHTSDQHPWFKRAKKAPPGSNERDFYVWSDTSDKFNNVRIIFKDFEASNWTWDPEVKAYYWHRFYSHQPDLNFDNPEVGKALCEVVDFWMKLGVDGIRLDAVPYLYEREGTSCENLPETHAFLKYLRKHIDERFKDKMLLAEANQWPEDAAQYFGDDDECHMAFHFPMMPRLFMAIHLEDRLPIIEIAEQTPEIPPNSQWALFLRNHDELTLEMVTDEDRDYMWRVYAHDPQARINLGIRHRLAPLLKNDRRKIELMNSLLFSLVGTPVLYYGDEIGMGDNIYLGDRDSVRTPMQWSADRNAGFSRTNPQQLFLPIILDSEYHYEAINVEVQQSNPHSLFWRTRQLIALRKRFRAFSRGTTTFLQPENRKVLVYVREFEDEIILIVSNLSRHVQYTSLDLSMHEGKELIELFSNAIFPEISKDPFFLTLGPYGTYWFQIQPETAEKKEEKSLQRAAAFPIEIAERGDRLFQSDKRKQLEWVLRKYLQKSIWFGAQRETIQQVEVEDQMMLHSNGERVHLLILFIREVSGRYKRRLMILSTLEGERAESLAERNSDRVVAKEKGSNRIIYDMTENDEILQTLTDIILKKRHHHMQNGVLDGILIDREWTPPDFSSYCLVSPAREDSHSILFPFERGGLKLFTEIEDGLSVDVEMRLFLAQKTDFRSFLPVVGYLEYKKPTRQGVALCEVISATYPEKDNALELSIQSAERFIEKNAINPDPILQTLRPKMGLLEIAQGKLPDEVHQEIGDFLEVMRLLGETAGQFHTALSSDHEDPEFAPIPFTSAFRRSYYQTIRRDLSETFFLLRMHLSKFQDGKGDKVVELFAYEEPLQKYFKQFLDMPIEVNRMRYHGQFTLENLIYTGKEFFIVDFEGNLRRSYSQRRFKRSALRDVVAMQMSIFEAGWKALENQKARGVITDVSEEKVEELVWIWSLWTGGSFLRNYLRTVDGCDFIPKDQGHFDYLLSMLLFERAFLLLKNRWEEDGIQIDASLDFLLHWLKVYLGNNGGDETQPSS